jgi:4-amino-4-deoxy-L-arabinose transferase-like glycosyltransferase
MLSLIPILFLEGRLYFSDGALMAGLSLGVAVYLLVTAKRRIRPQF